MASTFSARKDCPTPAWRIEMKTIELFRGFKSPNVQNMLRASLLVALVLRSQSLNLERTIENTRKSSTGSSSSQARQDANNAVTRKVPTDDFLTFCVDFDSLSGSLSGSRDYRVVAVTGCQCSGKSTLLNALFGTRQVLST